MLHRYFGPPLVVEELAAASLKLGLWLLRAKALCNYLFLQSTPSGPRSPANGWKSRLRVTLLKDFGGLVSAQRLHERQLEDTARFRRISYCCYC